ncbi:MAG: hypothetical protein LH481_02390 [Burkholderiales bacterium]|nr:hypothetical protein [Burkholderiales bacterium]
MRNGIFVGFLAFVALPTVATADPADYVKTTPIEYGERELEMKFGTSKLADGEGRVAAGTLGLGYGVTQYWFTEAYVKYQKSPNEKTRYDAFEWENKFLLTETGKYWADLAVFVELEIPRERSEGFEFRFGPLVQTEFAKVQVNTNLFLKRNVRVGSGSEPQVTELHYQLQAKYRLMREIEFGVQAFGELGKWNHWDAREKQNHRLGPALLGKIPMGRREAIQYDLAWLVGASKAAPDSTLRLQLEYEF